MDERIYKIIDERELRLHVFYPDAYDSESPESYPVAASFHGGAWTQGPIEWGHGDAQFMTTLGFVGIAVEYRLADYGATSALDCMMDASSAIRWIRTHASELNIDTDRILSIGHSAGGHLSLATAMFPHFVEEGEDMEISSVPNRVVALAPAVELNADPYFQSLLNGMASARECSPLDNIRLLDMPILIIHGSKDEILPISYTEDFVESMKAVGNDIELEVFPGGLHGFFYEDQEGIQFWRRQVEEFVKDF